ncbi:MAG TPA: MraY family glycosyltransferase [Chloroflexota bacterium]|nr:MraY family glycosyltransferase [Chloroflexota bacterium]
MFQLSSHSVWLWLGPALVAAGVCAALTPGAIRAATRLGIVDRPVGQKIHKRVTPLLGGVAVYVAFAVACVLFLPLGGPVFGILLGGLVAVVVGVLDDRFSLPPLLHLAGQTLAAVVTVVTGLGVVRYISIPWASANFRGSWHVPLLLGVVFSLFWIVGMMNTINFLDGLDGLSTGVGIVSAVLLAFWAAHEQNFIAHPSASFHHADLILPVVLAAALVAFLPYNWNPAKIFIGDSGAMFVGLALAALSIMGPAKIGTALVVLCIPVLDVAWAIVRRQLHGRSFLSGDKQHVYHRMLELGMSHTATVVALYAICIILALADYSLLKLEKLVAFGIVAVLTISAFVILEVAGDRRQRRLKQTRQAPEAS